MNAYCENPLTFLVQEHTGRTRFKEPVTFGIPFPKGMLADVRSLTLWDASGQQQPLQVKALNQWSDESCKWLLLDLQADVRANSEAEYQLRFDETASVVLGGPIVTLKNGPDYLTVQTGKASFVLDRKVFKPFNRVVVAQTDLRQAQQDQAGDAGSTSAAILPGTASLGSAVTLNVPDVPCTLMPLGSTAASVDAFEDERGHDLTGRDAPCWRERRAADR